jgi:hypothetical protein
VISMSRVGPLVVAVAASALLVAGPASAQTDPVPPTTTTAPPTTTTAPTTTTTTPPALAPPVPGKPGQGGSVQGKPGQGGQAPGSHPTGGGSGGKASNRPGRPAGDRDCPDFATQDQAQSYFESIGGSRTNDADRLDENHNGVACEDFFDDGDDQNAAVTPTGDDGSKATTSGNQVTDVPEGSAQTGGN